LDVDWIWLRVVVDWGRRIHHRLILVLVDNVLGMIHRLPLSNRVGRRVLGFNRHGHQVRIFMTEGFLMEIRLRIGDGYVHRGLVKLLGQKIRITLHVFILLISVDLQHRLKNIRDFLIMISCVVIH
jgi:hypothetical protein